MAMALALAMAIAMTMNNIRFEKRTRIGGLKYKLNPNMYLVLKDPRPLIQFA